MNQTSTLENIGTWKATVQSAKDGFSLRIEGEFPTNGEKPLFELEEAYPQGPNETELIMTLSFSHIINPAGNFSQEVSKIIKIDSEDKYKTVLIVGKENGEKIANIEVVIPK